MRKILILSSILLLSGCSSLKGQFENRVACTLDGRQMLVASMYGPIGIASKISAADTAVVCTPASAASAP